MNLLKKIALVAMTVLMGTGVAVGVGNTLETTVPNDQVAHAKNLYGGEVIFFDPGLWNKHGARFAAYFFNDTSGKNAWYSLLKNYTYTCDCGHETKVDKYYVVVPTGDWEKLIFVRMNGSNTTNDWGNKWNQTGNLTYNGTNNLFTVSSWDNQTTGWSTYSFDKGYTNTWSGGKNFGMILNGTKNTWASDNAEFGAYFYGENGNQWTHGYLVNTDATTGKSTYSFTSPVGKWTHVILGRFAPGTENLSFSSNSGFWGQTENICLAHNTNNFATEGGSYGAFSYSSNSTYTAEILSLNILNAGACNVDSYTTECWTNFKNTYSLLTTTEQDKLANAQADQYSTNYISQAMAKYDSNVLNNGADPFISGRVSSVSASLKYNLLGEQIENNNLILFICLGSALFIGLAILFKKRKYRESK